MLFPLFNSSVLLLVSLCCVGHELSTKPKDIDVSAFSFSKKTERISPTSFIKKGTGTGGTIVRHYMHFHFSFPHLLNFFLLRLNSILMIFSHLPKNKKDTEKKQKHLQNDQILQTQSADGTEQTEANILVNNIIYFFSDFMSAGISQFKLIMEV